MTGSDRKNISGIDADDIYTVSEITTALRQNLESEFSAVRIIGEVANFKAHSSGHFYLTLRDASTLIRLVLFKRNADRLAFGPKNGMLVIASGRLSHYGGSGQTQLITESMSIAGKGATELEYRRLLQKLINEGLTDPARKRKIAPYPEKIAVITSVTGAVIHDICETLARRWPVVDILHVPADVQGEGASKSIVDAFKVTNAIDGIDCVILARGGGSMEDLKAFNTEETAKAVSESVYPVITGIGHEVDTTICDYVSDLRAMTPTAAAELASPSALSVMETVEGITEKLGRIINQKSIQRLDMLEFLLRSSVFPAIRHNLDHASWQLDEKNERLTGWWLRSGLRISYMLSEAVSKLNISVQKKLSQAKHSLFGEMESISARHPARYVSASREVLNRYSDVIRIWSSEKLRSMKEKTSGTIRVLEGLYPLSVLKRGYSYCASEDGKRIISRVDDLSDNDRIRIIFYDGGALCRVEKKRKGKMWQ